VEGGLGMQLALAQVEPSLPRDWPAPGLTGRLVVRGNNNSRDRMATTTRPDSPSLLHLESVWASALLLATGKQQRQDDGEIMRRKGQLSARQGHDGRTDGRPAIQPAPEQELAARRPSRNYSAAITPMLNWRHIDDGHAS